MVQRYALIVRRASAALLLTVLLGACFPWDNPSLERTDLVADPAARIRMPRADELAHFGREREVTADGPAYAFDAYLFGTQASVDEAVAFYERELLRLGWTRDDIAVSAGSTDLRAFGWCRPRMTFRLAIKMADAFELGIYKGRTYRTVFDAGLVAARPDAKCPRR